MQIPEYIVKEDNWYNYKGVKPPERQSHGMTEDDIDQKLRENLAGHTCQWRQYGPEIRCTVGQYEHGKNIGVMKRLMGTDSNGKPILKDI